MPPKRGRGGSGGNPGSSNKKNTRKKVKFIFTVSVLFSLAILYVYLNSLFCYCVFVFFHSEGSLVGKMRK